MRVVGIDPGLTGALAFFLNGALISIGDMPVHDHMLDARALHGVIQRFEPDLIVCEQVHAMPKNGSQAAFSMGDTMGCIRTVAAIEGIQFMRVLPVIWKRKFSLLKKDKDASRRLASEMWPQHDTLFKRKKDDGRAEACLIGAYGVTVSQPREKVTA